MSFFIFSYGRVIPCGNPIYSGFLPLLVIENDILAGFYASAKSLAYRVDRQENSPVWKILPSVGNDQVFASYFLGRASLFDVYEQVAMKHPFIVNGDTWNEIPSVGSYLPFVREDIFKAFFPQYTKDVIPAFSNKDSIIAQLRMEMLEGK